MRAQRIKQARYLQATRDTSRDVCDYVMRDAWSHYARDEEMLDQRRTLVEMQRLVDSVFER